MSHHGSEPFDGMPEDPERKIARNKLFATERCTICRVGFDHHRRPIYPKLERRGKFWCCPRCGSSYGENPHPNCPALTAPPLPADGVREALDQAWEKINTLGGYGSTAEELAMLYGIEQALGVIEELGGMNPARRALASPHEQGEG